MDGRFEEYEPIPINLISDYAHQVTEKITDPNLQKVVAYLSLSAADADDDLDDDEAMVIRIYMAEWGLDLDDIQEIEDTI